MNERLREARQMDDVSHLSGQELVDLIKYDILEARRKQLEIRVQQYEPHLGAPPMSEERFAGLEEYWQTLERFAVESEAMLKEMGVWGEIAQESR